MRRLALLIAVTAAILGGTATTDVCGTWKVVRTLSFTALSTAAAEQNRIGTRFTIAKPDFKLDRVPCRPSFKSSFVDRDQALQADYGIDDKRTFGLPKRVKQIELGCFYMLQKAANHAIIVNPIWQDTVEVVKLPSSGKAEQGQTAR